VSERRPPRDREPARDRSGAPARDRALPSRDGAADLLVGRRAVAEAFESEGVTAPTKVWLLDEAGASSWWSGGPGDAARAAGTQVVRVPRAALDRMADGAVHQGVVAQVPPVPLLELEDLIDRAASPALLVLADGVEDPRNLGAIIRSSAAAGADGLILPERRSAQPSPLVAKASAGAIQRLPLARTKNVQRALETLRDAGIWSLGLEAGAPALWESDLRRPSVIVIGGEGRGLSRLARERCDALAGIPLSRGVASLNASVAASIALFEAVRQRHRVTED
jgi:23S rRNA (guanosine2251-2'-O)-methyltransferase